MKKMELQPAQINYFFKDGYIDFKNTVKTTFTTCGDVIADSWEVLVDYTSEAFSSIVELAALDEVFSNFFSAIGNSFMMGLSAGRLILSAILTPTISLLLSLVQAVVLIAVMASVYLIFSLVAVLDWLYRRIKKISTSCPQCQENYDLPTYVCTCGAHHTRLVPSKYGIFTRKCVCGAKLKTTFFNGRHKLPGKWECPKCNYHLGGTTMAVDISIPVVGGAHAGKTYFINMAISQIEKNASSKYNLDFKYIPNKNMDDYERNKTELNQGLELRKTSDTRLKYYQFYLTPKGEKVKNIISLCDVAGEAYDSANRVGGQVGFKYANAFLMLVDPLSIEKYREAVSKKIDIDQHGGSAKPMDEVLDVLINTLENLNCLNSKNMIKTDVAVVFTKCDMYGLNNYIGNNAIKKYMEEHKSSSIYDATNAVCESFLLRCGERNFLYSLKSKFRNIQFFTCSALGHAVNNGEAYRPNGVEEPVLWLIDKASSSIDLKEKWGKKL